MKIKRRKVNCIEPNPEECSGYSRIFTGSEVFKYFGAAHQ
jgi:hypothetical protein